MQVTATKLRQNIYRLLDQVLATGEPLEIERNGQFLKVIPSRPVSKLDRLGRRPDAIIGDPDALVHLDWSDEWKP